MSITSVRYNPNAESVLALLNQGEGPTLEFKQHIPSYLALAQHVSAFANAAGGVVLVGVQEKPPAVVGINYRDLVRVFDLATENIEPAHGVTLHDVNIDGRHVGMIHVERSPTLVNSRAGAFIREKAGIRPLKREEIAARLAPEKSQVQAGLDGLAASIAANTETISDLSRKLERARSLRSQWPQLLIGFVLGFCASYLVNVVWRLQGN